MFLAQCHCDFPCTTSSHVSVENEEVASDALPECRMEVFVAEHGDSVCSHAVASLLGKQILVEHLAQQNASAVVERQHQLVYVRIEAVEVLRMICGEWLENRRIEVVGGNGKCADELFVIACE